MSLKNIKKMQSERGFTIVELLIVIVVIGILAAIVIVAYNGVQNQAKTTKSTTNASTAQKKAESYASDSTTCNANSTTYPATASGFETLANSCLSGLGSDVTAQAAAPTATNGQSTVRYVACATGAANSDTASGYYVAFWDYSNGALRYRIGGTATGAGGSNGVYTSAACPAGTTASTS